MADVFKRRTNRRIREANEAVRILADKMNADYYDFNAGITDENGNMNVEYTIEGMHMYADGYMKVLEQMRSVLEQLAID